MVAAPPTPLHLVVGDEESSKRRQILDGARKVFLELGFDGASMGEIARAAGVSKGTLYVYFPDKAGLFAAIVEEEKREQGKVDVGLFDAKRLRDVGGAHGTEPGQACTHDFGQCVLARPFDGGVFCGRSDRGLAMQVRENRGELRQAVGGNAKA